MKTPLKKPLIVYGGLALIALIVWVAQPHSGSPEPVGAATTPVPTPVALPPSEAAPPRREKPHTTAELSARFAALHGRSADEVLAALAELGLPALPRHIMERLLARSGSGESFAKALLDTLLDYEPDRTIAWAITNAFPAGEVLALVQGAERAMKCSTQEDYWPSDTLLAMLIEHVRGHPEGDELAPYYGRRTHSVKWAEQNILNAATPEERANAIRKLAWQWTHTQVADSVDWARANLSPEEFASFLGSDFTSAQVAVFAPDLALQITEQMRGTDQYALWASSAAFGLVRHQRFDEAVALLESVQGPRRAFALHVMGRFWTIQYPAGATAWANTLPPADFAPALEGMYSRLPLESKIATTKQILASPADPALDLAVAEGLRRSAGGLDVASAATLLPQMLARRDYGALDLSWAATEREAGGVDLLRSKLWSGASIAAQTLARTKSPAAARAFLDTLPIATPEAALYLRAMTLPQVRDRNVAQAAEWVAQQLRDPKSRAQLEAELLAR